MLSYSLNPYISFIENRLFPGFVQRAVFHRLTGEIIEPSAKVYELLFAIRSGSRVSLSEEETRTLSGEVTPLVQRQFLIPDGFDQLAPLLDHYVARPIQNPALTYRSKTGAWMLVRTSMEHAVHSRKRDELPPVIEE